MDIYRAPRTAHGASRFIQFLVPRRDNPKGLLRRKRLNFIVHPEIVFSLIIKDLVTIFRDAFPVESSGSLSNVLRRTIGVSSENIINLLRKQRHTIDLTDFLVVRGNAPGHPGN